MTKPKRKGLLFSSFKGKFIGKGPIRRLNPRIPWDELDEDIKNNIAEEEKKVREIKIEDTLWIHGPCTEWEEEQIKIVHDNLQKRIEEIEKEK